MNKKIISFKNKKFEILIPDTCYYCDKGIEPKIINKFVYDCFDSQIMVVTFECPICKQIFFAKYGSNPMDMDIGYINEELFLFEIIGGHKKKQDFSSEIMELSKGFVENYNDAYMAEQCGCRHIVGIGYRRAFEFLVKDYAIKYNPDDAQSIKTMNLKDCVDKYFLEGETKKLLINTTWIGNDFAHYMNKHQDINIADLKFLVDLSTKEIENDIKKKNCFAKITNNK